MSLLHLSRRWFAAGSFVFVVLMAAGRASAQSPEWPVAAPEAVGLDSGVLDECHAAIARGDFGPVHSLLVIRHGRLAAEHYYRGFDADTLHPVYSVTKSVTSALVGMALDRGELDGLSTPLLPHFPEYAPVANPDPRKDAIILADVLAMRAGFDWNEFQYPYTDTRNPYRQLMASPDWLEFMLDRRMAYWPGTAFQYNSGCTILLSGLLLHATGRQAHELAAERLFAPLDITRWEWSLGTGGLTDTGGGLRLRPRDMAAIGQLYLREGAWRGQQLVPISWIAESMIRRSTFGDGRGYGYQWWLMPLEAGAVPGAGPDIWIAWGWGGQHIFVVPALDLVVVTTSGDYNDQYDGLVNHIQEFLADAIKPPDGDLTGDGVSNALDLAVLSQVLAGNIGLEDPLCLWPPMGDLNGNNHLDVADAVMLRQWLGRPVW